MADPTYVRQYFSDHAAQWLSGAYDDPRAYPIGAHRVRIAIEAITERIGLTGSLIDLGCGGGDLCLMAAQLGMDVTGVDIAEGMTAEAERRAAALPDGLRGRLRFRLGDALEATGRYDAVTALGLIEYLPGDEPFFRHADELLRPGGVLVVSCRNRLFNLASLNAHTLNEVQTGRAKALLDEIGALRPSRDRLRDFLRRLEEVLPALQAALAADLREEPAPPDGFAQGRRQHTPAGLAQAARAAGFERPQFVGVHPHPLLPWIEPVAPRFYNLLASAFESLERTAMSLAWSSAFIGIFSRSC